MPAVLTSDFRLQNTINFFDGFYAPGSTNTLYMFFAKTTSWAKDSNGKTESEQGFIIPQPNPKDYTQIRADFLGGVSLQSQHVSPVVPRVNFTPNENYLINDIVITDEYNVYKAVTNVTTPTKPTHTDGTVDSFKFLYKISDPYYIQNFVTSDWIPVYRNGNVGNIGNPAQNSVEETQCTTLMISKSINENDVPVDTVDDFRQIALWANPLDNNGEKSSENYINQDNINKNSGIILYIDNRLPIYRTLGQTEEFKILIGF